MLIIPKGYQPKQDIKTTEIAIKLIKDMFEQELAVALNLTRVSAPMFVFPETGLNDNLSGIERPVRFEVLDINNKEVEVVHSLAKWKRFALGKYKFNKFEGLYTDMNAIRRDEELDNTHSIYVDQWDWELAIDESKRNISFLKEIVQKIFAVFKSVETKLINKYTYLDSYLPKDITFLTTQELLDMYPHNTPKEREDLACKRFGAVFLMQIGDLLSDGQKHDNRAPDYDDWQLNGDMLFYYPLLDKAFEVSSMGIRVDSNSLKSQFEKANLSDKDLFMFHKQIINNTLPLTIGGGLGQSRICMFLLNKAHIGEVQASIWSNEMEVACRDNKIHLL